MPFASLLAGDFLKVWQQLHGQLGDRRVLSRLYRLPLAELWAGLWGLCREDAGSRITGLKCLCSHSVRGMSLALWASLWKNLESAVKTGTALGGDTTLVDAHSRPLVRIQCVILNRRYQRWEARTQSSLGRRGVSRTELPRTKLQAPSPSSLRRPGRCTNRCFSALDQLSGASETHWREGWSVMSCQPLKYFPTCGWVQLATNPRRHIHAL